MGGWGSYVPACLCIQELRVNISPIGFHLEPRSGPGAHILRAVAQPKHERVTAAGGDFDAVHDLGGQEEGWGGGVELPGSF